MMNSKIVECIPLSLVLSFVHTAPFIPLYVVPLCVPPGPLFA
jgi:hypothetical protein